MPAASEPPRRRSLAAVVFDIDGVVIDSPHERAWRAALDDLAEPERFTTALYQQYVAGKPRLAGAQAALEQLGVPDAAGAAPRYAERKQKMIEELIESGSFAVFPDALRFILAIRARGFRLAAASSSKNANRMMELVRVGGEKSLRDLFDANVCGRDLRRGKPDPEIFLVSAAELGISPERCLVIEDAPAGIAAARAAGMAALAVARLDDAAPLAAAGADLVVTRLDQVDLDALERGELLARPA
jgi:HAD superfamily hydrolase (TIGR01509 family)